MAGVGAVYIQLTKILPLQGPFVLRDESDDLEPLNNDARQDSYLSFELPNFSNISRMPHSALLMCISHDDATSPVTSSCTKVASTQSILPNTTRNGTPDSTIVLCRLLLLEGLLILCRLSLTGRPTHTVQAIPHTEREATPSGMARSHSPGYPSY